MILTSSPLFPKLSPFRVQQLVKEFPKITNFHAFDLFFVDGEVTEEEIRKVLFSPHPSTFTPVNVEIEQIVQNVLSSKPVECNVWITFPRSGTISPWSSKATDIAKICHLNVERIEHGILWIFHGNDEIVKSLYDEMTHEAVKYSPELHLSQLCFNHAKPRNLKRVEWKDSTPEQRRQQLESMNKEWGLALDQAEMDYLLSTWQNHNPTDAELVMFGQVNSEHCRHKIFRAIWHIIQGSETKTFDTSLFDMIRNTMNSLEAKGDTGVLSAYSDNAAVLQGPLAENFLLDSNGTYHFQKEPINLVCKVETHNHPTAVSPYPGAATGSGGEIRDEGAVGTGSKPRVGLVGYTVSNLGLNSWEFTTGKPSGIASSLDIMLKAPLGACSFNNEFGRPGLTGYFRTFTQQIHDQVWGYHKPIMIAGGMGVIRPMHTLKREIPPGAQLCVLGGHCMLIGLGGGAASSGTGGSEDRKDLDFASVQRENPEMQRRCQQVIDACTSLGDANPLLSIHDVGAGGLSNALPELVWEWKRGAIFNLRAIPNDDPSMSPMEIWCNESQERYVLAVMPQDLKIVQEFAAKERCPLHVVGHATEEAKLVVYDEMIKGNVIDLEMEVLFSRVPRMIRQVARLESPPLPLDWSKIPEMDTVVTRLLSTPTIASKSFLITIGDRSVTGLVAREQMVGKWQVPVADVAVACLGYKGLQGQAMSMGERPILALINPKASARMAVGESLLNLFASPINQLKDVKLSCNWMCAANHEDQGALLYEAVQAVGMDLCPSLDIAVPVGKDSMSMKVSWKQGTVTSPVSLIVSAFVGIDDVSKTKTPCLTKGSLIYVNLGQGRLATSCLASCFDQVGDDCPDVDLEKLKISFDGLKKTWEKISAYHDVSDGGMFVTVVEMCFAGRVGVELKLDVNDKEGLYRELFAEELGFVIQVSDEDVETVLSCFPGIGKVVGKVTPQETIVINDKSDKTVYKSTRATLQKIWSKTSFEMAKRRDNPDCAQQEFDLIESNDPGLTCKYNFEILPKEWKDLQGGIRPKVAILREQGVNGHVEMAAAFDQAGFESVDVHMSQILQGKTKLKEFVGLVACGGFSFGDVLGAGIGWAQTILLNPVAKKEFTDFFARPDTFTLGVCNGCQMASLLKDLIPGAQGFPRFVRNISEQFEARTSLLEIADSRSIFFDGMQGSVLPVAVAHGEGRVDWVGQDIQGVTCRYVDGNGKPTEMYPLNPNGSKEGITGVTSKDGRVTILMPHPERCWRRVCNSWVDGIGEEEGYGPWFRMFVNARIWVSKTRA